MSGGLVVLAAVLTLAACGDDGPVVGAPPAVPSTVAAPAPSAAPESAAPIAEIVALDNSFRPDRLTVAVGTEVHFQNRGRNEHDALSVEGGTWGVESAEFGPGAEYVHVFDQPGTYRYYCSLHGNADAGMVGTIVVEEAGG